MSLNTETGLGFQYNLKIRIFEYDVRPCFHKEVNLFNKNKKI